MLFAIDVAFWDKLDVIVIVRKTLSKKSAIYLYCVPGIVFYMKWTGRLLEITALILRIENKMGTGFLAGFA